MKTLFAQDLNVINVGLHGFADNVAAAGGSVTQLSWAPPAGAQAELGRTLAGLVGNPVVEEANTQAYARYLAAQPRLIDLVLAREALPGLGDGQRRILHSGPPIDWDDMCGPQRGAITGAILYEGWADSLESAERLHRARPLPRARRRRADGGDHQPVNARVGGREHRPRQPCLLQPQ